MMRFGVTRLLALALLVAIPAVHADERATVEEAARAFYTGAIAVGGGLPDDTELAAISGVLSRPLVELIEAAIAKEEQCRLVVEGTDKPDIVEGDLFVGSYEGASEVLSLAVDVQRERAVAKAQLAYIDERFPKGHRHRIFVWTDELVLVRDGARWVIEDVTMRDGTLRGFLTEYGASRRVCGESSAPHRG